MQTPFCWWPSISSSPPLAGTKGPRQKPELPPWLGKAKAGRAQLCLAGFHSRIAMLFSLSHTLALGTQLPSTAEDRNCTLTGNTPASIQIKLFIKWLKWWVVLIWIICWVVCGLCVWNQIFLGCHIVIKSPACPRNLFTTEGRQILPPLIWRIDSQLQSQTVEAPKGKRAKSPGSFLKCSKSQTPGDWQCSHS